MNILKDLLNHAKNIPDLPAVMADDGELSYKELFAYMLGFAELLAKKGAKSGDKVVIRCHQNIAYVVAVLGTQLAGCTIVPIEADISQNRLDEIKNDIGGFFYFDEYSLDDFTKVSDSKVLNFSENSLPDDDNVSVIFYTTGTTGKPKGIMLTFDSEYAGFENIIGAVNNTKNTRLITPNPLNHCFAIRRLCANLICGGCTAIIKGVLPIENFKNALDRWNINSIAFNPNIMNILMQNSNLDLKECFKDFIYMEFSNSALHDSMVDEIKKIAPKCNIYNVYGSSEFAVSIACNKAKDSHKGCIGEPTKNTQAFIVDDNGNELKDGEKGYLALKGKTLMKGYVGDENATKSVVNDKGMYVTQDICYKNDGFIYFVGRDSDVINIGGLKIGPDEIEDIANTHPLVIKSACVPKAHKLAGQVPVVFLETKEGFSIDEFYTFLRPRLQNYQFPKEVIIIEQIPLTYNGKINRKELKTLLGK